MTKELLNPHQITAPHLLVVLTCAFAATAFGQTPALPPRNVDDVLRILSQYSPDPSAVEKLRLEAMVEPPETPDRQMLAVFYHRRARANELLGRHASQLADLYRAYENAMPGSTPQGEGLGNRNRIIVDLVNAEVGGGNFYRAIGLASQGSRSRAHELATSVQLTDIYVSLGDLTSARGAANRVATSADALRGGDAWRDWGDIWQKYVERSQALVLEAAGSYLQAERHLRAGLALDQTAYSRQLIWARRDPNASAQSRVLLNWAVADQLLARNLRKQGRVSESESYARSALSKLLQRFGRYSPLTAASITELGWVVYEAGRFSEADALARAAIESYERAGVVPESPKIAMSKSLLGASLVARGLWHKGIKVFEERESALRLDAVQYKLHSALDQNWGLALLHAGDRTQALVILEAMYRNRLKSGLQDNEYYTAEARGFYAMALAAAGQSPAALAEFRGSLRVLLKERRRISGGEQEGAVMRHLRIVWIIEAYLKLLAEESNSAILADSGVDAVDESFRLADVARGSSVQRAMAQSTARQTPRDDSLADLARREQDVAQRLCAFSKLLNRVLSAMSEEQQSSVISDLRKQIDHLQTVHAGLTGEIAKRFPEYAELVDPKPPSISQVQSALRSGETLLSVYVGADASYVWAVPERGNPAFIRLEYGEAEVARDVSFLRRALDYKGQANLPEFDAGAAHDLFSKFLLPVSQSWREAKHLIVVPSKSLARLPFAVLTTEAIRDVSYREAPWLIRRVALSQLPTVNSFLALRRMPPPRKMRKNFIGFGDPIFGAEPAYLSRATMARSGPKLRSLAISMVPKPGNALPDLPMPASHSTVLNSSRLSQLSRLEDTALEIESIAKALKADPVKDVYLRSAASERNVKSGLLSDRRIVVFATHGLKAGELDGLT